MQAAVGGLEREKCILGLKECEGESAECVFLI